MNVRSFGTPSRRRGMLSLLTLMVVGCEADQSRQAAMGSTIVDSTALDSNVLDTAAEPGDASPDSVPLLALAQRHFDAVPDSVLLRAGVCPFECCVYGEWRADSEIPILVEPANDAIAVDTLHPSERFRARTGYLEVTGPAIVVVLDTVPDDVGRDIAFVPGDTLVVLDHVGEGAWNVWHDEQVKQVSAFWGAEVGSPKGAYYGAYRREWWVNAESPRGRSGWFRADLDVELSGVDACGTPI